MSDSVIYMYGYWSSSWLMVRYIEYSYCYESYALLVSRIEKI